MPRSTASSKAEADLERLTQKIQATQKFVEQAPIEIGEDLIRIRETGAYKPDTFDEYCLENFGLLEREIYRYIDTYKLVQATRKHLGEAPRSPMSAERVLWKLARKHPEQLRAVQSELKKRGLSVATAASTQIEEAVKVVQPRKKKPRKPAA